MAKILLDDQSPLSDSNVESLVLYNSAASPCARRCRITLIEKGLDYDTVEMDLPNMEHRRSQYLALNPNGYVPTLSHGEQVIYDSGVINEYLEAQFPNKPLFPKSAKGRGEVRMWIGSEESMSKEFRPLLYQRVLGPLQHISRTLDEARLINARNTHDPIDMAWGDRIWKMQILTSQQEVQQERKLLDWLDTVEAGLINKTYLVAEQFTQADISVFPRVVMFSYLGLDISPIRYPNVLKWMAHLQNRPSFEASMSQQAKKLRKMATSPLMPKLRSVLKKPQKQRSILDNVFVWGLGKMMRKIQNIQAILTNNETSRALPLPKLQLLPLKFTLNSKPNFSENSQALTLYAQQDSPHSQRIVKLLNFLGLTFIYKEINVTKIEHQAAEFKTINPLCEVPMLMHGEFVIHNSRAIAEYLIEQFDHQQLWWGSNSLHSAKNRMWLALEAGTNKEFSPLWEKYLCAKNNSVLTKIEETSALKRIHQKLQVLENTLRVMPFLCGDNVRYADIAWFTRITGLTNIPNFTFDGLPKLKNWYALLKKDMDISITQSMLNNK